MGTERPMEGKRKKSGRPGCVYLVGGGPGDKGLITVRGAQLLSVCDCIIYDHLAGEELLAYGRPDCEKIFVGKEKGCHYKSQEEIHALLIKKAGEHAVVVRLKGGDPFVFGRGGEEAMALAAAGIPYEVVPGVTSAVAVPEAAGIPVTFRQISRSFQVITGATKEDKGLPEAFYRLKGYQGTVVFLMGVSQLAEICEGLIRMGWDGRTPAAVVQNGTLPGQRRVSGTLSDLPEKARGAGIGAPAVIVAGETAGMDLRAEDERPLKGLRVGITGTDHFTGRLKGLLESLGAQARVVCRLQVVPSEDPAVEESYAHIEDYTWLVFTSANGVRLYLDGLLEKEGRDLRCLGRVKIAAMGKGTKEALLHYHLKADYIPQKADSRTLALGLCERLGKNDQVLLPRARQGSKELTAILDRAGIACRDLALYDVEDGTTGQKEQDDLAGKRGPVGQSSLAGKDGPVGAAGLAGDVGPAGQEAAGAGWRPELLVFASASGVHAYFSKLLSAGKKAADGVKVCCIGEATAGALSRYGVRADCIAREASAEGIVKKLVEVQKSSVNDL